VDALVYCELRVSDSVNEVVAEVTVSLIPLFKTAARAHVAELVEVALLTTVAAATATTAIQRDEVLLFPLKLLLRVEHCHLAQDLLRAHLLITILVDEQRTLHIGESAVVACGVEVVVVFYLRREDVEDVRSRWRRQHSVPHGLHRAGEDHCCASWPLYIDAWRARVIEGICAQLGLAELGQVGVPVKVRRLAVEIGSDVLTSGVEVVATAWAVAGWHEAIEAAAIMTRVYRAHRRALGQHLCCGYSAGEGHCVCL